MENFMTGTTKGIYKFDAEDQTFILDSVFFRAFGNEFVDIHRINPDLFRKNLVRYISKK
jgi:hypothetical protein